MTICPRCNDRSCDVCQRQLDFWICGFCGKKIHDVENHSCLETLSRMPKETDIPLHILTIKNLIHGMKNTLETMEKLLEEMKNPR